MNYTIKYPENLGGMNERIRHLRQQNFDTPTTLSIERALIETAFYKENYGTMPPPGPEFLRDMQEENYLYRRRGTDCR